MSRCFSVKDIGKILVPVSVSLAILSLSANAIAKEEVIKYLHSSPFTAVEMTTEGLSAASYYGALEFMLQNHSKLKGKYQLKYVGDVFKDPNECLTAVASGAGQMTYTAPQFLEQFDPFWKIMIAPGVFDDFEHFQRAIQTPVWKEKLDKFSKDSGLTIVKWMGNLGDFYLFTETGPITKVEDIKGQKIRYNGAQGYAYALKDTGATGIALPYTEVVTALQTNMIEGLLNDIYGRDFYNLPEFTKYLVPISWGISPMAMVVNTKWWESLPEEERTVMQEVFDRVEIYKSFDKSQKLVEIAWDEDPRTELVKLSPEEEKRWKETLFASSVAFGKDVPKELMDAINNTRNQ